MYIFELCAWNTCVVKEICVSLSIAKMCLLMQKVCMCLRMKAFPMYEGVCVTIHEAKFANMHKRLGIVGFITLKKCTILDNIPQKIDTLQRLAIYETMQALVHRRLEIKDIPVRPTAWHRPHPYKCSVRKFVSATLMTAMTAS